MVYIGLLSQLRQSRSEKWSEKWSVHHLKFWILGHVKPGLNKPLKQPFGVYQSTVDMT
jgi:hypothetical protein